MSARITSRLEPPQVVLISRFSDFADVAFTYEGDVSAAWQAIIAAYSPRRTLEADNGRLVARIALDALGDTWVGDYIYPGEVLIFDYPAAEAPAPPTSPEGLAPWRAELDAGIAAWQQDVRRGIYATPGFIFSASPLQIIAVVPEQLSGNPGQRIERLENLE